MRYMLKTMKNERERLVFAREKRGNKVVYLAKSEAGEYGEVDKNWILKNKDNIINLGVSGTSIYPISKSVAACCRCGAKHKTVSMKPVNSSNGATGYICKDCLKKEANWSGATGFDIKAQKEANWSGATGFDIKAKNKDNSELFSIIEEQYRECVESLGKAYWNYNIFGDNDLDHYDKIELVEEYGTYDKNKYGDLYESLEDDDIDFYTFYKEANIDIDYYKFGLAAIEAGYVEDIESSFDENTEYLLYELRDILLNWKDNKPIDLSYLFILLLENLIEDYFEDYSGFTPYYLDVEELEKDYIELYKKEHNASKVKYILLNEYTEDLDKIYNKYINIKCDEYNKIHSGAYNDYPNLYDGVCVFVFSLVFEIDGKRFKNLFDEKYMNAYKKFYLKFLSLVIDAVYKKIKNKNYNLDFIEALTMDDFGMQNGKVKLCNEKNREAYKLLGLDVENY